MAETNVKLSVTATTARQLPNLDIKNGQLIFVKDEQSIALDLNDKRIVYKQIVVLQTDSERTSLLAPISGLFYFVKNTNTLWTYQSEWKQITVSPESINESIEEISEQEILNLFN